METGSGKKGLTSFFKAHQQQQQQPAGSSLFSMGGNRDLALPVSRSTSCTMLHSTTPRLCLPGRSRLLPGPSVSEARAQTQDTTSAKPRGSGNITSLVPSGKCLLPTLNFWGILGPPFAHSSSPQPWSQHPVLNSHYLKLVGCVFQTGP